MRTSCACMFVVACLVLSSVDSRPAQAQRRGAQPEMERLNGEGVVKAVQPRVLMITVGAEDWLVAVPNDYQQLLFEGKATVGWLQRGMPIQITAMLVPEKRKKDLAAKEPITELTVAPVPPNSRFGVYPEQTFDQRGGLFSREKKQTQKRVRNQEPVEQQCMVIGQLVDNKDGKLRLNAGGVPVLCELDPKAEITVRWHDVRWVRVGDKVQVNARYPAGRKGRAQAETMTITTSQPLDIAEPPTRGRTRVDEAHKKANEAEKVNEAETGSEAEKRNEGKRVNEGS